MGISETKKMFDHLRAWIEKNRSAFSNYNMVRMREAIRYFSGKKLEIFIKIPFLVNINCPAHPGFTGEGDDAHGIFNFENSGFYKEAANRKIFPKSIIATRQNPCPAVIGFYHIGSLGTFTQSSGSDFDYWVIIDKKQFSQKRYDTLEKKLDAILKYSREAYDQRVSFFIMDEKDIQNDCYAPFKGEERLSAPKVFLKEEFYRTFLMIAGRIPLWSVLSGIRQMQAETGMNADGITAQVLSMYDDLIDLGSVASPSYEDVFKGLLWHICKSGADPVKAVIKACMIFSYGFNRTGPSSLLCEQVRQGYATAGIDDYRVDPYKVLFDRILEFQEQTDPRRVNLVKNAVFFRLCRYPDVRMPEKDTPKRHLVEAYIRKWKLSRNQVNKLLSYSGWSEPEKLLLEKAFIQHLARMVNHAVQNKGRQNREPRTGTETGNWTILKNKTRERLNKDPRKIPECSCWLRQKKFTRLTISGKKPSWELGVLDRTGVPIHGLYTHPHLLGVLGWIFQNRLYHRHRAVMTIEGDLKVFESTPTPVDPDRLYLAFQPLKPLSEKVFEQDPRWAGIVVLLVYDPDPGKEGLKQAGLSGAEVLVSNTWGELFLETMAFDPAGTLQDSIGKIADLMSGYGEKQLKIHICQLSDCRDPDIVYQIKKAYNDRLGPDKERPGSNNKPYLDRL